MSKVIAIAAMASYGLIGDSKTNDLPWPRIREDLQFFAKTTIGEDIIEGKNFVLMGRKTFESIPDNFRPLENRINGVITRQKDYPLEESKADFFENSLEDAIRHCREIDPTKDIYIAGGGSIYHEAIEKNFVDKIIITYIAHSFIGDIFFPAIDPSAWERKNISDELVSKKDGFLYQFSEYNKIITNE
jgi:dihydrofolate reductase